MHYNVYYRFVFAIGLSAVHAWLVLGDIRFSAMMAKFEHESTAARKQGKLWAVAYVIGTAILLTAVMVYLNYHPVIQSNELETYNEKNIRRLP